MQILIHTLHSFPVDFTAGLISNIFVVLYPHIGVGIMQSLAVCMVTKLKLISRQICLKQTNTKWFNLGFSALKSIQIPGKSLESAIGLQVF
jgi:hypothetical protein